MFFFIAKIQNEVSPNFNPLNQHAGRGFMRIVVLVRVSGVCTEERGQYWGYI
jgi:hypothetical protein